MIADRNFPSVILFPLTTSKKPSTKKQQSRQRHGLLIRLQSFRRLGFGRNGQPKRHDGGTLHGRHRRRWGKSTGALSHPNGQPGGSLFFGKTGSDHDVFWLFHSKHSILIWEERGVVIFWEVGLENFCNPGWCSNPTLFAHLLVI